MTKCQGCGALLFDDLLDECPDDRGMCNECCHCNPEEHGHLHSWGSWYYPPIAKEIGDITRSRWCDCGAYEIWRRTA